VLATEIKNNGFKLARWTAQALLSGADEMKIGYVTRTSARESKAHAVLGVQRYKAVDLAQQLNLEAGRMWGTLRRLSEAVLEMPDGKYLLIKEPNEVRVAVCTCTRLFVRSRRNAIDSCLHLVLILLLASYIFI
jgi:translation initiation factor 3 subunit D